MTELKSPIELVIEPRISGGLVCAVAKTADDGGASVTWDIESKSWVLAKGLPVGTVFSADIAPNDILIAKGINKKEFSYSRWYFNPSNLRTVFVYFLIALSVTMFVSAAFFGDFYDRYID